MSNPDLYVYGHELHKNIPIYRPHTQNKYFIVCHTMLETHFLKIYPTSDFNKLSLIF